MKILKDIKIAVFIAACILFNCGGRMLAGHFGLPIWFDTFGTTLSACQLGPFCGAVAGLTTNIIFGIRGSSSFIYSVTSAAAGILIGIAARKKAFDTVFWTATTAFLVSLTCTLISVPINLHIADGMTNNVWGDGVIGYLSEKRGIAPLPCSIIGEFFVEFPDKLITLMLNFALMRIDRIKDQPHRHDDKNKHKDPSAAAKHIAALSLAIAALAAPHGMKVSADQTGNTDLTDYVRTVYSSDNGLPCGESNDIAQTGDGILWIGTYAGLYRYNGAEFRWMNEFTSVRNVNCLYVDAEGRLWIGTNDNGLSISINENIVNVVDKDSDLPSDSVKCITQSSDGEYYVGTTDSLALVTLNNGLRVLNVIPQISYAVTLTSDENGNVAAVTTDGKLFLLNGGEIIASGSSDSDDEVYNCCTFSKDGTLYVGTSRSHIVRFDVSQGTLAVRDTLDTEGLTSIQSISFPDESRGYICADNGVGYLEDNGNFSIINTGVFNNSIDNMLIDHQGNLWFTSSRLGLLRLTRSPFTDIYRICGIDTAVVNSIQERDGLLYCGTDEGLDIADLKEKKSIENELTELLEGIRIRCIRRDRDNNLWICTYGQGLMKVAPDGSITDFDNNGASFGSRTRVVLELSDGRIVAAGDTGLSYIEDDKITQTLKYGDGLSNTVILSLLETSDGALLAGTDGNGIAVIKNGEVVRTLSRYDGLTSGVILRMTPATDGKHILVVTSNGLCCIDEGYKIRAIDNFPYPNNYDVWADKGGRLFVMSSAGIYVVAEKDVINDKEDMYCELLDSKRGMNESLTANSWNYSDDEGNLYFSSDAGAFKVDTNEYSSRKHSYRLLLNKAKVDGTEYPVEQSETLSVPRGTGKIEIFPEVINFTTEDPYVSCYLEGFDPEPTIIPQSELASITYTNLPTGTYRFHLAVLDTDMTTELEECVYVIQKEKEIYDNGYFIVYMLVVGSMIVVWFTWFIARTQIQRTITIQRKQLEIAEKQVQMGNETILAIARTVDAKDENTSQHSQRVSEYSVMIGKELGFDDEECEKLRKAALLHDIGKIGIPDRILNKPARLTDEEYAIMKTHVTRGAEILKDFTLIENVVDGALYHHERYDGTGYVHGLKGEDIPIYGRIIGVADAFDAMTANRVYRQKLDFSFVTNELKRCRGTQFDPVMADIMLRLIDEGKIDIESIYGKKEDSDAGE